jgi:hypothetical protein
LLEEWSDDREGADIVGIFDFEQLQRGRHAQLPRQSSRARAATAIGLGKNASQHAGGGPNGAFKSHPDGVAGRDKH